MDEELKKMIKHYFPDLKVQSKYVQRRVIKILKDFQKEKQK